MVARHSLRFAISCTEDLRRAEEALRSANEPIIIEANQDSTVLSEIGAFRHLAISARSAGADVSFTSDDPLRRELARIAGLHVLAPEPAVTGVRRALEANAPTRQIETRVITPSSERPTEPSPTLTEVLNDYTDHGSNESYASFSFVITPPIPRRQDQPTGEWHYHAPPTTLRNTRRRGSKRVGKIAALATIFALVLLLTTAATLVALIAPQATITLVPTTSALNADVRFGVAGQGTGFDVAIEPEPLASTMTFSATIPTTGTRIEPDGSASGEILLTNPMTWEITVPAGTRFTAPNGVEFTTVDDVVVPAADPFGTLTMGSATIGIAATVAGADGNIEAQSLSGQLPDGLFYSNRDATSGGTVKEIRTVSESDIEILHAQAAAALEGKASDEVIASIPEGYELVGGSVDTGALNATFDHEAGADATELTIQATQDVSALVYDPATLQQMARDELNRRLVAATPRENVLLADSIEVSEPVAVTTASGNPEFRMTASARSRTVLDEEMLAALKRDLVGTSMSDAGTKVATVKGVARFDIEYGPEWFPFDWAPRLESRIAINIDDSTTTESAAQQTGP